MSRNNPHAIFARNAANASESDSTAQSIGNGIYVGFGLLVMYAILRGVLSLIFGETAAAIITLILVVLLLIVYLVPVVYRDSRAVPVPMALVLGLIFVWLVCGEVFALVGGLASTIVGLVGIAVLVAVGIAARAERGTR